MGNCSLLTVNRLIARGHLTAVDVGGRLRILPKALELYVASGAPDFRIPADSLNEFLARETDRAAYAAYVAIRDALGQKAAEFSPEAVANLAKQQGVNKGLSPVVRLAIPPSVIQDKMGVALVNANELGTQGDALLAQRLLQRIGRTLNSSVERLFESRTSYDAATAQASNEVLSWVDTVDRKVSPQTGTEITLRVESPVKAWADQNRVNKVIKALF